MRRTILTAAIIALAAPTTFAKTRASKLLYLRRRINSEFYKASCQFPQRGLYTPAIREDSH